MTADIRLGLADPRRSISYSTNRQEGQALRAEGSQQILRAGIRRVCLSTCARQTNPSLCAS